VPGEDHGELSGRQLLWLRSVLEQRAPDGSVVVLHHPPLGLASHPLGESVLRDPQALANVIDGTDVSAILCGHLHMQINGNLSNTPVIASPGVLTRIDLTAPRHLLRGLLGGGATIIDLSGSASPVSYTLLARDPQSGSQAYLYDVEARHFLERRQG
jgi:3',5'-cyclic-AMP phosphodiesterase